MINYSKAIVIATLINVGNLMAYDRYQDFPQLGCIEDAISLSTTIKNPKQRVMVESHLLIAQECILNFLSANDYESALDVCHNLYKNIGEIVADCEGHLQHEIIICIRRLLFAD